MSGPSPFQELWDATDRVRRRLDGLTFQNKVAWSYNPLNYAEAVHRAYLERYADQTKQALFLGMNPGPWGMGQTGVPFSDTVIASDWMELPAAPVGVPPNERDERPVLGWQCDRTEGSGQRFYSYVREVIGPVPDFLSDHFVMNYCPLIMFGPEGNNVTPEDLLIKDRRALFAVCDPYLESFFERLNPSVLIGIGRFGEARLQSLTEQLDLDRPVYYLPHPSPASPIATRDGGEYWKGLVTDTLREAGVLVGE